MNKIGILKDFARYVMRNGKQYLPVVMDMVVFISTKLLKKKLSSKLIVNQNQLDPKGFNNYWGLILNDMVDSLDDRQMNLLVNKYGLDMKNGGKLFESVIEEAIDIDDEFIDLLTNKTNFLSLDNGKEFVRLDMGFDGVEAYPISLKYYAIHTDGVYNFVSQLAQRNGMLLSYFDVQTLIYHYEKYWNNNTDNDTIDKIIEEIYGDMSIGNELVPILSFE